MNQFFKLLLNENNEMNTAAIILDWAFGSHYLVSFIHLEQPCGHCYFPVKEKRWSGLPGPWSLDHPKVSLEKLYCTILLLYLQEIIRIVYQYQQLCNYFTWSELLTYLACSVLLLNHCRVVKMWVCVCSRQPRLYHRDPTELLWMRVFTKLTQSTSKCESNQTHSTCN